jgi:TonB-dependent receptor
MQTNSNRFRVVLAVAMLLQAGAALAQVGTQGGRIVGRVRDSSSGAGIAAVAVHIAGTSIGTLSGADGRYVLDNVPPGGVALQATSLGYATRSIALSVAAGAISVQDIELSPAAVAIDALEVTAGARRGSVDRALQQQRAAAGLVNTVTAEQISGSGDGDAAQVVQRVSGATVQDGKFVVVRGLGERYTTTSLNGARLPSAEPERKLVPLDLFPSGLLEQITTIKTFTADQPGDFSGASVDLKTREFPLQNMRTLSMSFGFNPAVTGRLLGLPPSDAADWLAFGAGARSTSNSTSSASASFRNVWSPQNARALPNGSLGFLLGGNAPFREQGQLGYVLSATYANAREVRTDEVRAQAQSAGTTTVEIDRYEGSTTRHSVLWGGVANFNALLSGRTRLAFNNTYNRSADNDARFETGISENYGQLPLEITRLRYVERMIRSQQLLGTHELGAGTVDWSITNSAVSRLEPDRSEIVYARERDPQTGAAMPAAWFASSAEGAVRTFGDLKESAWEAEANLSRKFGAAQHHLLKLGVLARTTSRTARNDAFSITAPLLPRGERALSPEQIFAATDDRFRTAPLAQGGSYAADDRLFAGYGVFDWQPSDKLLISLGARVEHSDVDVTAEPTVGAPVEARPSFTDVLPSLAINYRPDDRHVLKLSAAQTLSRPEYRELAGVQYREVLGGDNVIGNPGLRRTLVHNFDLRYERYPSEGELLSVAAFAKFFRDPIERIYLGTSGTRVVTFLNAEAARNYGVELELRKRIAAFMAFANLTAMRSEIVIGSAASGASRISDERPMVGQSPFVINAGVTYQPRERGWSATVLYNVFGERIVSAAEAPLPDVYELPRHAFDLSVRLPLQDGVSAKLDIRNFFDQPYEMVQGSTTREFYRTGRVISAGVSWQL